jgi:hypothetical protein
MMNYFITCTFLKYNWNDGVKENKMDRVCSIDGERTAYRVLVKKKNRRKETTKKIYT